MKKILRVSPWKFDENFPASECDANYYINVFNDDEHEYRLSFIINLIINTLNHTCFGLTKQPILQPPSQPYKKNNK